MSLAFANGPVDRGSIPGRVIPKTQKLILDVALLNTQHNKVRIKVKWSNPGKGVGPSLHLGVVAIENGVFVSPMTSKSPRPFNNPLVTVPKSPITIGIIVTFMFHNFFQFSRKVKVLISLFKFFQFYSVVCRDSKVYNFADFFFCF